MVTDATARAEATERDSRTRAENLDREAKARYDEVLGKLSGDRVGLEQKIEELRVYEREYRGRLKSWITEQLAQLDGGHPRAAAGRRRRDEDRVEPRTSRRALAPDGHARASIGHGILPSPPRYADIARRRRPGHHRRAIRKNGILRASAEDSSLDPNGSGPTQPETSGRSAPQSWSRAASGVVPRDPAAPDLVPAVNAPARTTGVSAVTGTRSLDATPTGAGSSTASPADRYPRAGLAEVAPHPDFPAVEREVLDYWDRDETFQASVDNRPAGENGSNEFVFYDGPPFANGLPHYGHLLTGYVKDVVPRYQTMRGRRVERRFGWDTHGLPAEVEAERQLGIKHKSEIEAMGVEAFNDACRQSVLRYTHEWQEYVTRQARWVDFANDYKTLDLDYMESVHVGVQVAVGQGPDLRGLPGALVLLALRDTAVGNRNQDGRHLPAAAGPGRHRGAAAAVGRSGAGRRAGAGVDDDPVDPAVQPRRGGRTPDVEYVVVRAGRTRRSRAGTCWRRRGFPRTRGSSARSPRCSPATPARSSSGPRTCRPSTSSSGRRRTRTRSLAADYVTTEDGTGIVHIAPAFGEEDKAVTDAAGIEVVNPVDAQGKFTSQVPPYEGYQVFDANIPIMADLKAAGLLVRRDTLRAPVPALLAVRDPADPACGVVVVRRGDAVP